MTQALRKRPVRATRVVRFGGKRFVVPSHVLRVDDPGNWRHGWLVKVPGVLARLFTDGVHGGSRGAFDAACAYRAANEPSAQLPAFYGIHEHADKSRPTGTPGVICYPRRRNGCDVGWIVEMRVGSLGHGRIVERRYLQIDATEQEISAALAWARMRRTTLLKGRR